MNTSCVLRTCRLNAFLLLSLTASAPAEVTFTSPGFKPSILDEQARLVEDWGAVEVKISGASLPADAKPTVTSLRLDNVIPAAQSQAQHGPVAMTLTAFRAPVWPAGLDVLTVNLEETSDREVPLQLSLSLPETVRIGSRTVAVGGRTVITLPEGTQVSQATRDWGWDDDATALTGWARPATECDPAFRNIRAGMGGVPIHYAFKVEPKVAFNVVLGFCESHWAQAGQRPLVCHVEGAPAQEIDPVARWGQHQPGALLFAARDDNGDGKLEVAVLPKPGAPDQNPILNALWIFSPAAAPKLDQVIAGRLNVTAARYVDVGGPNDQSLHAGGKVEYALKLPAKGKRELTFLVACAGGSAPLPDKNAWTPAKLRQSAAQVWREWKER